jgi:hypothetical protein
MYFLVVHTSGYSSYMDDTRRRRIHMYILHTYAYSVMLLLLLYFAHHIHEPIRSCVSGQLTATLLLHFQDAWEVETHSTKTTEFAS